MIKKLHGILAGILLGMAFEAMGASYIVLFSEHEQMIGKKLPKRGLKLALQDKNDRDREALDQWLKERGKRTSSVEKLWFISAATIDLEKSEAKELAKASFVEKVYENKSRSYLKPLTKHYKKGETTLWGLTQIGLERVREKWPDLRGQGVRVGILDTGIQSGHAEFEETSSIEFQDFVNGLAHAYDDHGHGTHVAGTISGVNVGIAPQSSLLVGKIFTATGSGFDAHILSGMQWMFDPDGNPATDDAPKLVSNSWGLTLEEGIYELEEFLPLYRAVASWAKVGIVPLFAAGNSGMSPNGIPAGFAESIAVGALAPDEGIAEFSSRGPNLWRGGDHYVLSLFKPDLSAPGQEIFSSFPPNDYSYLSGTSMATPHVAGALALLFQVDMSLTPSLVKKALIDSVTPVHDLFFGHGTLNLYKLLENSQKSP